MLENFYWKLKRSFQKESRRLGHFDDIDLTVHAIVGYGDRFPEKLRELLDDIINTLDQFRSFNVWEEFILSEISRDQDITLENVLSVYRYLRENYDYYLKYEGSGKFFIGEMETKRLFAEMKTKRPIYSIESFYDKLSRKCSTLVLRLVLTLYRYISLYGESLLRPIIWILATILFFSFLRTILIVHVVSTHDIPRLLYSALLGENLLYSLAVFFQLVNGSRWDIIIERLIAIPIVSSLYITLRRKLERRIRH